MWLYFVKSRELETRLTQTERDRLEETEPLNVESGGALDTAFACKSSREGSNAVLCTSGHFKSENAISRSEMNHSH